MIGFKLPPAADRDERLRIVMNVLYLLFNEGYAASSGPHSFGTNLAAEAIRLARLLDRVLPDEGEVVGLLALMLLIDARRAARTDGNGLPVPLGEERRHPWDPAPDPGGRGRCCTAPSARACRRRSDSRRRPNGGSARRPHSK